MNFARFSTAIYKAIINQHKNCRFMKKLSIFLLVVILTNSLSAQWTTSGTNIYNSNAGNVGIGTTTPAAKLQVVGSFFLNRPSLMQDGGNTIGITSASYFAIAPSDLSSTNNSYISLSFPTATTFRIGTDYDGHLGTGTYRDIEFGRSGFAPYLVIKDGGNVGIGTTAPGSNKLAVEGTIGARAVKVTLTSPWPDYVFTEKYSQISLANLEAFIAINKHLPNIPTANEVNRDGVDLGQMTTKLLEKIEELTMYVVELKKENDKNSEELRKLHEALAK